MKKAVQTGITHPAIEAGMVENHTITTIKLNATKFQQLDKSQFMKAPEFAQISGYINTPNNNHPITLSSLRGKVVLLYIWTYTWKMLNEGIEWSKEYFSQHPFALAVIDTNS